LNISITLVRWQKFKTYIKNFYASADVLTGVKGKPNGGKSLISGRIFSKKEVVECIKRINNLNG